MLNWTTWLRSTPAASRSRGVPRKPVTQRLTTSTYLSSGITGKCRDPSKLVKSRATLVVCAVSLVGQWVAEAKAKLANADVLNIHMYHGTNRCRDPEKLAKYDLVVTTYATLASDYGGKRKGKNAADAPSTADDNDLFPPLGQIQWHRVVLDESHTVKNPRVAHTMACTALKSNLRWCMSGTPINTDVTDLQGQAQFLRFSPLDEKAYYEPVRSAIMASSSSHSYEPMHGDYYARFLSIMRRVVVRHSKKQTTADGSDLLTLPEKDEEEVAVTLPPSERKKYTELYTTAKKAYDLFRRQGPECVARNYLQISSLLLPLRRMCSGGTLSEKDLSLDAHAEARRRRLEEIQSGVSRSPKEKKAAAKVAPVPPPEPGTECPICMDALENPLRTKCSHWFCEECIDGVISSLPPGAARKCPLCRSLIKPEELAPPMTDAEMKAAATAAEREAAEKEAKKAEKAKASATDSEVPRPPAYVGEAKLKCLMDELKKMQKRDPSSKALVFSQFTSTIEWLKQRLSEEGYGYRYINGAMPLRQRAKAIEAFQGDPPTTVFLLSIRASNCGINLTAADHVFILEPALNPSLDDQAIGRAWRMGQTRKVTVKRMYVKDSVEERILELVKSRKQDGSGGGGGGGGGGSAVAEEVDPVAAARAAARGKAPVTTEAVADLAGSLQRDRQKMRSSEFDLLFSA